jgi:HK97 gp10 family phage protein
VVTVDTSEIDALAADLASVGERVDPAVRTVNRATGATAQRLAKGLAPKLTGTLAGSIEVQTSSDGMTTEVGPTVDYAGYVEYGTSVMGPEPYMGPAFEATEGPYEEALGQVAERVLS